ncbi:hypothetical protein [Luteolibacter marinus]|uniref:hypothetical protein n=1 Tax=Luteolibacter marinus TaxID=2776705 RepID=UPI0018684F35|nr:hypothetical protein [Luteolibacter marinus]
MRTLLLALVFSTATVRGAEMPEGAPAIAITLEQHLPFKSGVLLVAWPDGTVIWSGNAGEGGPPYQVAHRGPDQIRDFLASMEKKGLFKKDADFLNHLGPDASYHSIVVRQGRKSAELSSWHECFEANPKLVATSHGITSLDGARREEVLRGDTPEYREFRGLWESIRRFGRELTSHGGEPWNGKLKID